MQTPRLRLILYGVLYVGAMLVIGSLIAFAVTHSRSSSAPVSTPLALPSPVLALPTQTLHAVPTVAASPIEIRPLPTSTPLATFTPAARAACYVVQRGDTVNNLARRYNVKSSAIMKANPWLLRRKSYWLYPGDCLVIPK